MIEQLLHPQLVQALGWTLLHSLWQGAAFALVLATLLIGLRSYTAQARYTVSAGLLAAFFLTVGSTFYQQWQQADPNVRSATITQKNDVNDASAPAPSAGLLAAQGNKTPALASNETLAVNEEVAPTPLWKAARQTLSAYYTEHLPLLVTLWLMGVLVLQLRFLGQLAFVQRLKHYGTKAFPEAWSDRIEELESKLRIQKKVVYRTSLRASSPMVIGWMKPVILFPQLMLNKLSDTEIYAVLAHELAHVRRDDFVINLLQTLLTNVFFFHPGVWWMSNQVDDEREHCCDDLAILATGQAMPYAKTLLNVSQLHRTTTVGQPQLAMAMSGTDKRKKGSGFAERVKRLFSTSSGAGTFREGFTTACILFGGLGMAFAFTNQTEVPLADHLEAFVETQASNNVESISTITTATSSNKIENPSASMPSILRIENAAPIVEIPAQPGTRTSITTTTTFSVQDTLLAMLLTAVRDGNLQQVQLLLDRGADINGTFVDLGIDGVWSPLLLASSENQVAIAKLLVARGADVNLVVNGWTPLLEAADEGSLETLNFLLTSGADINWHQGPNSPTALSMAASEGKINCLVALLKAGADINGFSESLPPLHAAANEGKTDVMRALITRGANVNQSDAVGRTALMYAASEGLGDPVALLVSSQADPNLADYTGMRAVEFALEEGAEDLAHFLALITESPACETHLKEGHTHSHFDVQVDSDVHLDMDMDEIEYPRSKAAEKRYEAAMKEAAKSQIRSERAIQRAEEASAREERRMEDLERKAEARERQRFYGNGGEVLDAVETGDNARLQGLLEGGADANVRDSENRTALINAIISGDLKIVKLLLQFGADPQGRTDSGWTPLHFAALQGNTKIIAQILNVQPYTESRANYSSTDGSPTNSLVAWDYKGATPLLIAIENNDFESTKLLIAAGANPDTRMKKVEFTRVEVDANGFGLSQVTNAEERLRKTNTTSTSYDAWTPRLQANQQNNPRVLALLNR